ncbi:DNA repair protein RadA [Desulfurobacterium thermolithotrophum DSM 11699]|uniref:DNA repair protein RadA n=1 Tax=Desulfurobacterium thermolithotrophum (strain DSM 11699 / BSA) TaxID=868864 RepID=F0S1H3_DESTD|nr:DNA repair protein RadA [Desulfurobacterium thermolithotrophum]ADY73976.1 DNA repair protein RadA [Desulfurobacterium thermolithotrophum DSM 11699]
MTKRKSIYICQKCGYKTPKWAGKCPECGSWGSLVEEIEAKNVRIGWIKPSTTSPLSLEEIGEERAERILSGISEFDRVLGGGIVKGSVSLLSGEPGIGKSTFLLQLANKFSDYGKVLYVTAEESPEQVALRAKRLEVKSSNIYVLAENNLEEISKQIEKIKPVFVVFDSIQTLFLPHIESAAGSVSQVRESAAFITNLSKSEKITSFIVGHVTKEGTIAGPKVLEHIVDAVFQFEGDKGYNFRVFKSLKNRFGSTGELAVFEMTEKGLREILNPSEFFLSERPIGKPGSVIFAGIEGSRPLLLEVQALVTRAVFSTPQRRAKGIDANRLSIIVAVIEKELGYPLRNFDIFVNVVGGVKISEPAVDLPIAAAIISSYLERPVKENFVLFGEIGLTGEVRKVKLEELREKEAKKNGFEVASNISTISQIPDFLC